LQAEQLNLVPVVILGNKIDIQVMAVATAFLLELVWFPLYLIQGRMILTPIMN
jgi:hypothetical protein